jgi:tetratricopeptide (TPR) repeat protein
MSKRFGTALALALLFLMPAIAGACLWDHDTLVQERGRFPSALELITGKFLRHSPEFYQWRIEDRRQKLAKDPKNLAYHDDLAVAYQKVGDSKRAIETMLAKDKIKPGVYETYSNLGTFYILSGNLKEGLVYVDKALGINPNAHFGREKYQAWLVEYAIGRSHHKVLLFPLRFGPQEKVESNFKDPGFREFLADKLGKKSLTRDDSQAAVKGILGMMRFADYKNPLLLEALGDVLMDMKEPGENANLLAARAYLRAAGEVTDAQSKERFKMLARRAMSLRIDADKEFPQLERDLEAEIRDAEKWYASLRKREIQWIKEGQNVEAEFDQLYTADPSIASPPNLTPGSKVGIGKAP